MMTTLNEGQTVKVNGRALVVTSATVKDDGSGDYMCRGARGAQYYLVVRADGSARYTHLALNGKTAEVHTLAA